MPPVAVNSWPCGLVLLHNSLDVDTAMYDAVLMDLFNALSDEQKAELHCTGFSELDSMMAQWLI